MVRLLRIGLWASSVLTAAMTSWLAATVVLVVRTRDPDRVVLWSVVAAASLLLVVASAIVTDETSTRTWPPIAVGFLGAMALAFGGFVVAAQVAGAPGRAAEGYLLLLGLILVVHGALALAWLAARRPARGA
ncbi:MAG TPA: hypothetical protein VGO64_10735 [Candidatus Limnocylindrales bacterium]|nr:hypothetical protein [Candidatus Limnocylindrales bacterium]